MSFKYIILSKRIRMKRRYIVYFYLYKMVKKINLEIENRLMVIWEWEWGLILSGNEGNFWSGRNF